MTSVSSSVLLKRDSWVRRHHFLLRRLHSLSGILPLGVFLLFHLSANASIWRSILGVESGRFTFDWNIHLLHESLGPLLVPVELGLILIPLFFHLVLGVLIWATSQPNDNRYGYLSNRRYTWQRTTAIIAIVFVIYHLWHMHWLGAPLGGAFFDKNHPAESAAAAMQASAWVLILYTIGVVSVVYHFANGLWTSLIVWGITIGPRSQKWSGIACLLIGLTLGGLGLGAVAGFASYDLHKQKPDLMHDGAPPMVEKEFKSSGV